MDVAAIPLTELKGVGPKLAEKLGHLGLRTAQDILFHLPHRYEDRTRLTPIGALIPGTAALISGTVQLSDVVYRGRRALVVRVSDGTGYLHLRFFYFGMAQQKNLVRGARLRIFGDVRFGPAGIEMVHPEYQVLDAGVAAVAEERLTPVYPATEGVHVGSLRRLARQALDRWLAEIPDWLPAPVLSELALPTLRDALDYVHFPPPGADLAQLSAGKHPTQTRLAFEELLAHQLSQRQRRAQLNAYVAPSLQSEGGLMRRLLAQLPFSLTGAQQRVLDELIADIRKPHPMQRLVQGDVGSGKTVVAAAVSLMAVESACQVAVMAPTELLAEQHYRNFSAWFTPLGVNVMMFSGRQNAGTRKQTRAALASGACQVAVGTHALFQDDVAFANLGLIVVDEQHRFGVQQRLQLREKGRRAEKHPHQLTMTATPIPRTLAQSLYADLDVSAIDELPPGRKPVETVALQSSRRAEVVARVHEACRSGRQAYWVCPAIDESDVLDIQAATETAGALQTALPDLNVALLHGRMKPKEKEQIMGRFQKGDIKLLVATTVIEVGVDVPNATLMIVENAERLGLSQLHQLRGRVGRGAESSACVLLYQPPLSEFARARIAALRETNDGFEIASKDLEMRGPGELFGTRQAGLPGFRIADIMRDAALLPRVQRVASVLLAQHPEAVEPLMRRWVGGADNFGVV